jgi:hypothetical protein
MSRIWPSDSLGDFVGGFFGFRLARISMYINLDEVRRWKERPSLEPEADGKGQR